MEEILVCTLHLYTALVVSVVTDPCHWNWMFVPYCLVCGADIAVGQSVLVDTVVVLVWDRRRPLRMSLELVVSWIMLETKMPARCVG